MNTVANMYEYLLKLDMDNKQIHFMSFAHMDDFVEYCCFISRNDYNNIGHAYLYINLYEYIRVYPEEDDMSKLLFLRIDFTFWKPLEDDDTIFKSNFRYDLYWYNRDLKLFNIFINKLLMDEIQTLDIKERIFDDYDFDYLITSGISYNLRTGEKHVIGKTELSNP
jgi:hypothetical protein